MKRVLLATILAVLAGCASFSGLDASTQFACKAPDGILCESMSGIYANAAAQNLPGQRVHRTPATAPQAQPAASAPALLPRPLSSGTPLRTPPRVLRVWIAPWEDSDGDLHDQSYLYLTVDTGRWVIEHNRRRIRDTYRPVRPPGETGAAPANVPTSEREATGGPATVLSPLPPLSSPATPAAVED